VQVQVKDDVFTKTRTDRQIPVVVLERA